MTGASPSGRFPRTQHVRKRGEFRSAQDRGRRVTTPTFVLLLYAPDEGSAAPRLGVVASRKIGTAVVRNRAKRLVREAFRSTRDLWNPGIDLVVIVRRALSGMLLDQVVAEWRAASAHVSRRSMDARSDRARRSEQP